jgi:hypothetical protein
MYCPKSITRTPSNAATLAMFTRSVEMFSEKFSARPAEVPRKSLMKPAHAIGDGFARTHRCCVGFYA